jgi:glutamate synthase domain-containing protein 2/glutamate synthase domain-containing protein 1/glutamate synthase domain-containing protein 3
MQRQHRTDIEQLLYRPEFEHDSCGVGFIANISGSRSHWIVERAIEAVVNLTHRGAVDADAKTGDGAGILTQVPLRFFQAEAEKLGLQVQNPRDIAIGMIFLPGGNPEKEVCGSLIETIIGQSEFPFAGWRAVPTNPLVLGDKARETQPDIQQAILLRPEPLSPEAFERALYLMRREIENAVERKEISDFHIPSFSARTIVYKGLFVASELRGFYLDLQNRDYETALAVFHQRYSTNTSPTWPLAQPFRMLAHNGEINTLQGNRNWMRAREPELSSPLWEEKIENLKPIVTPRGSDSASLDNVLEALTLSGRDLLHSMMILVPEAYESMPQLDHQLKSFYEYHACLMEPWDGPAALAFSDGRFVGATLDRNGLRPARYKITADGVILLGSEVGVVDFDDATVIEKGRLGPGRMIAVDTARGLVLKNDEIKKETSSRRPYAQWIRKQIIPCPGTQNLSSMSVELASFNDEELIRQQKAFGYSAEDLEKILAPMARDGKEPVGSMGDDTPLAVLSSRSRLLYNYFKQLFAQVTNPPIDPLRERLVMSLNSAVGYRRSLFGETEQHARLIKFSSPILSCEELLWVQAQQEPGFGTAILPALFDADLDFKGIERTLQDLCEAASNEVDRGKSLLIVSDRGVSVTRAPFPTLLAVSAIHHRLIREGKRMKASLIVESGDAREEHHFACLLGYGASAICPYIAFQTVARMARVELLGPLTAEKAVANYKKAIESGVLKIMSKMGISTLSSYQGSQVFEAVGMKEALVDTYFPGTVSRIGGIGMEEIAQDILGFHRGAFGPEIKRELEDLGYFRYRHGGEYHSFSPAVFKPLHKAVKDGDYEGAWRKYTEIVQTRPPTALRDLLEFRPGSPLALEEVEPVESIFPRFTTAGMSLGALSREAHETLAIAMNRIGARSNSGEGGESKGRYHRLPNGDWANSATKQVASARFGVTPEYLISAKELQIKMAQGSKPGEGGQLPGHKVSVEIAAIRHSVPGVTLISPPPHHDIYSIEDLSQLIYDLKQVNPRAKVSVKLVAEAGVGTVAAGVVKAYADIILISGHDGGTGASPLGSIKHAGIPWELGLAETQQVLVMNDLRGRVMLQTDGGLKTGRDVVVAAMLGAEEFGFGSAAVVAAGCVMARQCHLNTCPVGVATQREDLRSRFPGIPEHVVNFFTYVAQEVREILASLGFRKLDEIIGRADLLQQKLLEASPKIVSVNLSKLLAQADSTGSKPLKHTRPRNDRTEAPLDDTILQDAIDAIAGKTVIVLHYQIRNTNRAVGAKLAGEIAFRYGDEGLPEGAIECHFKGSAGQSFGAFCIQGLRLVLTGQPNDYVGKSMAGGEIIIRPPQSAKFPSHTNTIIGNTVMYGATGGSLFAAGQAGERFCVRNSGGMAVVEGVGDHGCEYMTGGVVVILGRTGRNFGAGMTGGTAFVLDEDAELEELCNPELVSLKRLADFEDVRMLRSRILQHQAVTRSLRAQAVLDDWANYLPRFWKVVPRATEPFTSSNTSHGGELLQPVQTKQ